MTYICTEYMKISKLENLSKVKLNVDSTGFRTRDLQFATTHALTTEPSNQDNNQDGWGNTLCPLM